MRVLITGAAGYIGSHVARALDEAGHETVLFDDLSTGFAGNLQGRPCHRASVLDRAALDAALPGVDAVAHLAGAALVPESVRDPAKYWRINLAGGLCVVEAMLAAGVKRIVFSSTCAVYGVPEEVPIPEDAPQRPITPYGASKAAFERLLAELATSAGLQAAVFRYFNAAGAHGSGEIGEVHDPETHLVPIVLDAIAGRREKIVVHGTDYETPDGTCVRDYVDVRDIARAHLLALEAMAAGELESLSCNLGSGQGDSVFDVIRTCTEVAGRAPRVEHGPRRPGDPPRLLARAERAERVLGWRPEHDLRSMVEGAWRFAERHHGA